MVVIEIFFCKFSQNYLFKVQINIFANITIESLCIGNENKALMVDEIFSIESYQFNSGWAVVIQFYLRPES